MTDVGATLSILPTWVNECPFFNKETAFLINGSLFAFLMA
jgi:hypothetical protein